VHDVRLPYLVQPGDLGSVLRPDLCCRNGFCSHESPIAGSFRVRYWISCLLDRGDVLATAIRYSTASVGHAILLLVKLLGVEPTRWSHDAGENRQNDQHRCNGFHGALHHVGMRATPLLPVTDVRMVNTCQPERSRLGIVFEFSGPKLPRTCKPSLFRASCRACCPVCLAGEAIARVSCLWQTRVPSSRRITRKLSRGRQRCLRDRVIQTSTTVSSASLSRWRKL
jgi:hypothetical protein